MHIQQLQPYPSTLFCYNSLLNTGGVVTGNNVDAVCPGGGSAAARAHNAYRQSSTCWRWSPRTSAGLSARQSPPSAPLCPSGQRKKTKQAAMWVNIRAKRWLSALLSPRVQRPDTEIHVYRCTLTYPIGHFAQWCKSNPLCERHLK